MSKAILITGQGQSIKDKADKIIRCSGCEYLHSNGNCLKVGGFYSSIDNKYCPKQDKAGGNNE